MFTSISFCISIIYSISFFNNRVILPVFDTLLLALGLGGQQDRHAFVPTLLFITESCPTLCYDPLIHFGPQTPVYNWVLFNIICLDANQHNEGQNSLASPSAQDNTTYTSEK